MLVAPIWEESVNVQTCYGINMQPNNNRGGRDLHNREAVERLPVATNKNTQLTWS